MSRLEQSGNAASLLIVVNFSNRVVFNAASCNALIGSPSRGAPRDSPSAATMSDRRHAHWRALGDGAVESADKLY